MRIHYTRRGSFLQELCKYLPEIADEDEEGVQNGVQMSAHWGTCAIYYNRAHTRLIVWHVKNTFSRIDRRRRRRRRRRPRLLLLSESGFIFEPKRLYGATFIMLYTYIGRTNKTTFFQDTPEPFIYFLPHQISILCTHESYTVAGKR